MANDGPGTGSRGESSGAGGGPQTLAQLQGTGAEVVGSDGEKVGDLKTVGDADIVVGRPLLRSDLHVPVERVREVTPDNRVVLDVSAEEAREARWGGPSTDTSGGAEEFSESTRLEKGALELVEDDPQRPSSGRTRTGNRPRSPIPFGGANRPATSIGACPPYSAFRCRRFRGRARWSTDPVLSIMLPFGPGQPRMCV